MRALFPLAIALLALSACETSPLGGRCTNDSDCDRSTTGTRSAHCVNMQNPSEQCGGSMQSNCICCPVVIVGGDSGVVGCGSGLVTIDVVTNDTSDVSTDVTEAGDAPDVHEAGDASDAMDVVSESGCPATCPSGMYCPAGASACINQRTIGQSCGTDVECGTGHCVSSVCCNSACTDPGHSCNASPDFAGICMSVMSDGGGG